MSRTLLILMAAAFLVGGTMFAPANAEYVRCGKDLKEWCYVVNATKSNTYRTEGQSNGGPASLAPCNVEGRHNLGHCRCCGVNNPKP